jgi:uncharacterized protein (TIGR04255 family)
MPASGGDGERGGRWPRRCVVELARPPVIEVGIEFHFDPRPDKEPWSLQVTRPFVERCQTTFPHVEVIQAEQLRIEKRGPGGIPEQIVGQISLNRLRAHNEQGTRWVQIGNDLLVFSLVRREDNYPGFATVRDEALGMLDQYVEHFKPLSVRRVALTYLDLIEIPIPPGRTGYRVEEFFRLHVEMPDEPFGPVAAFSLQLQFPQKAVPTDQLALLLHTVPRAQDRNASRVQMYWRYECDRVSSLDKEVIVGRLETAHQRLRDCFMASFTEQGLALFQLKDDA